MGIEFTMSGFAVRINGEIVADSLPSEEMARQVEAQHLSKHRPNGNGNGNGNTNGKKESNGKKKGMFSEYGFFSP